MKNPLSLAIIASLMVTLVIPRKGRAEVLVSDPKVGQSGSCSNSTIPPINIDETGHVQRFKNNGENGGKAVNIYVIDDSSSVFDLAASVRHAADLYNSFNIPGMPKMQVFVVKKDEGLAADSINVECKKFSQPKKGRFPMLGVTSSESIGDAGSGIIDHSGATEINCADIVNKFPDKTRQYFQQVVDHELAHSLGMADDYATGLKEGTAEDFDNKNSLMGHVRPWKPPFNGETERKFVESSVVPALKLIYGDKIQDMKSDAKFKCIIGSEAAPPKATGNQNVDPVSSGGLK